MSPPHSLLLDRAVVSGLLTKVIQGLAGPLTAVLILFYFEPAEQGYYYTFLNLLALQIFVDLGLSTVITTFAAHEWVGLSLDPQGRVVGNPTSLARLGALAKKALRWYAIGTCILLALLGIAGFVVLSSPGSDGAQMDWEAPWFALCFVAAANLILTPGWALLLGCGQVSQVNSFRMIETLARSLVLWVGIVWGGHLWAPVFSTICSLFLTFGFFTGAYRYFFRDLLTMEQAGYLDWEKEVSPMQWRIAISWVSGYFAFFVFTPVTFHYLGPVAAGQMGMTWAIVSGLSGLASTWSQVRAPLFASLVARKKFAALDALAMQTATVAMVVVAVASLCVIGGLLVLEGYRLDLSARLLPVIAVAFFLLAEFLHQVSIVQSTYLRAFKQEPFFGMSIASGATIGIGTFILTGVIGLMGPALSYLAGVVLACTWGTWIFIRDWRKWTFPRENKTFDGEP